MKRLLIALCITIGAYSHALCNITDTKETLATLESQGISSTTNPQIRELYEKLTTSIQEYENTEQKYMDDLRDNANAMKDTEQSTKNKTLGAAGIGTTGLGGMQTTSAMAEQSADDDAETAMRAYSSTFICNYGDGKNFSGGTTNIELPQSNLTDLKSEYLKLATDLKQRKVALDLPFGIESDEILDAATSGLYDDIAIGKTDGAFTSLSNAIANPSGPDANEWATQKSETAENLKSGTVATGIGAIGSAVANMVINKDAPDERSAQIKSEYESKQQKLQSEISETQSQLNTAIANNKQKIQEYNTLLNQHIEFVKTITDTDCIEQFREYIDHINSLQPITDDFADTSNLTIPYELSVQQSEYTKCVDAAILARKIAECESQPHHKWISNECVDQTPTSVNTDDAIVSTPSESETAPEITDSDDASPILPVAGEDTPVVDPDQCPAENPRMRSLTDKNRVGDPCTYGDLTAGRVFKRSDGTCSCTATACKTGFIVDKGMCIPDNNTDATAPTAATATTPIKLQYFAVCKDAKGKSGGTEYCIDKPFNRTNVQMLQAAALAAEYALVKNGHDVRCENEWRKSGNDDWFSCTSVDNKHFYEFKFDDVVESVDATIQKNVRRALCESLYDGEYNISKTYVYDPDCELSDENKRHALKQSAAQFGITATVGKQGVNFSHSRQMIYTTQKIDGIDPFAFYSRDIQIRANGQMIDGLYEYAALQLAPRAIKTFTCNRNPIQVAPKIDDRKIQGSTDDVLTCYIDGTPVDFVFDDMSEASKKLSRGGYSNMNCTVAGGAYNGSECMYIGETQCKRIQKLSAATMPSNKLPFWNSNTQQCELPAAADATEYQRNMNIGIMVGGIIVGAVVTVATGGTAAPVLALVAVETAGGVIEITQTQKIYDAIDEFLAESQKCNNASCAESMLHANLQRMSNMTFDMTDAQLNGIDHELARLASLIPSDSQFYQDVLQNGTSTADNHKGFFDPDSWEPEQVWRAVGITLQLASLIGGIGKWVAGKVNKLPRATTAIKQGAKNADNAAKMTSTQAKRLDEIDNRLTKIQAELNANPSASRASELRTERTRLTQEKNTILNKVGTKDADEIANAKTAAYSAKEIQTAQRELDDARTALQRRLDWESKQSPNALKNDLQSRNSAGRAARDKVRAAEQKLRDMGETVTPMEFRSVDDILNTPTTTAAEQATKAKQAENASSTKQTTSATTDQTSDIAKGTQLAVPANFSQTAKNVVNDINEIGTTKEYAVIRGIGPRNKTSELPITEENYITQLINDRDDLIFRTYVQPDGTGGDIGANRFIIKKTDDMFTGDENMVYRRINTKPVNSLRGRSITTINGKQVFLEQLDNGGFIGNISGRPVVVVNYDGHKIPFYASSGSAGKLDVPTGKWEVFFGFGQDGWFNKTDINAIVNHYNSPELKQIANALDDIIGDQRNVENVFATISRKYYNGQGTVAHYDGPAASRQFINQMLDFTPINHGGNHSVLQGNIEHIKRYFR